MFEVITKMNKINNLLGNMPYSMIEVITKKKTIYRKLALQNKITLDV